jgi:ribosomal protein L4
VVHKDNKWVQKGQGRARRHDSRMALWVKGAPEKHAPRPGCRPPDLQDQSAML